MKTLRIAIAIIVFAVALAYTITTTSTALAAPPTPTIACEGYTCELFGACFLPAVCRQCYNTCYIGNWIVCQDPYGFQCVNACPGCND